MVLVFDGDGDRWCWYLMVMVIDGEDEDNMMEAMEDPSIIIDPFATSVDEGINSKRETMQLRLS